MSSDVIEHPRSNICEHISSPCTSRRTRHLFFFPRHGLTSISPPSPWMVSEADQRRRRRKKKKKGWMGQVRNESSIRKETEGKTVVRSGRDEDVRNGRKRDAKR